MKTEQQLRESIMRRVYGVYFLRQASAPVVRVVLLGVLALALKQLISITSVLQNLSHTNGVSGFFYYVFSAFTGTEFLVQLTVLVGAFVVLVSIRDVLASINGRQAIYT